MHSITARNVNSALPLAVELFKDRDNVRHVAPRGMATIEALTPVATTYFYPCERVLFHPLRDANPFFHFFESLWVLAGREDVQSLAFFVKRMSDFSDDGSTFHGAYGRRMFGARGFKQVENVIAQLQADRDSRRAAIAIWQPHVDSGYTGRDMPCNTMLALKVREDQLNMTVFCRSNDMTLGAYGANVVQFSTLLEYIAARVGVRVGSYTQVSDSFHVYEEDPVWQRLRDADHVGYDAYHHDGKPADWPLVRPRPLVDDPDTFDHEVRTFWFSINQYIEDDGGLVPITPNAFLEMNNSVFNRVAVPLLNAYTAHKRGEQDGALHYTEQCAADDWKLAAGMWLARRYAARGA